MAFPEIFTRRRPAGSETGVREPAVAGRFYADRPDMLRAAVGTFLRHALPRPKGMPPARVLVAPHAGYIYSGQIAADAFAQAIDEDLELVVVLGASHTRAGAGAMSVHPGAAFRTPLGDVLIDEAARERLLAADPSVRLDAGAHESEHSIEVHLPFVQVLFPRATLLPIVVGCDAPDACERLGRAVAVAIEGRRALIVASSDLSHYPGAGDARWSDAEVLDRMLALDPAALARRADELVATRLPNLLTAACGLAPVLAATTVATETGALNARVVSYANSADVAIGDAGRVVGYGAVAFSPGDPHADARQIHPPEPDTRDVLDEDDRRALVALARATIEQFLESETLPLPRDVPARLHDLRHGAFVTLKRHGLLRGCIGRISHEGPLPQLVSAVAYDAAFRDPRFSPLGPEELEGLHVEVSVLTPLQPVRAEDIDVGRHGVLMKKHGRTAVFLPKVATEQGWSREELLEHLCRKAGLPPRAWASDASLFTFEAEVFNDDPRG